MGVTPLLRGPDVPGSIPGRDDIYGDDEDWRSRGNTTIVRAGGEVLAGAMTGEEGILYADLDVRAITRSRRMFDAVGHYARPDVLRLVVDRRAKHPVGDADDPLG